MGTNYSGVEGESEERIQITKRDQRRSQPTATLRGSVDINASVIFCPPRAKLRGKTPTRASYKFRTSVDRQPSWKDEKKQGLSPQGSMHFNLGLFFALLLRRKSCFCLSAIRREQGQAATARACERRPLTERAQPALTIKRPRETLTRLFLPTTPVTN